VIENAEAAALDKADFYTTLPSFRNPFSIHLRDRIADAGSPQR
jgi:hypothetical protein